MGNVNSNRPRKAEPAQAGKGRMAQRGRTRRAIVQAAMALVAAGKSPSMSEIADAAEVSRRTVYMYFPTLEQLLLDATLGALTQDSVDAAIEQSVSDDPVERALQLSRSVNSHSAQTIQLGRALIRLTVEGDGPPAGGPRRGYRRVQWIEQALAPARASLSRQEFNRLVSAMCLLIGWEPLIVLKDIRCLDEQQTQDVLTFAVQAVVEKALSLAAARRTRKRA